ncbi:MAG: adenosylcobinamide-GDP ribazoletransferase [Chloroflexi bacterium]|nr:adenosylcobinamide-GDP ribazoletransferase [Chloroflexota bacterium]
MPVGLRLALGFLTTLPVSTISDAEFTNRPNLLGQSFAWYPLVGAILGLLLFALASLLRLSAFSSAVQAGCLLTFWIVLSGGLHLDGLLDSCDALFASVSVARRLVILKDVHMGAFGAIGLFVVLGMKWALLTQLVAQHGPSLWSGLWLAPVWGRWMLVWAAQRYPYARADQATPSLGGAMRQGLDPRHLYLATASTLFIFMLGVLVNPTTVLSLLGPVVGLCAARWAARQLNGGLTGDIYGALCEVTELLALFGLALLGYR